MAEECKRFIFTLEILEKFLNLFGPEWQETCLPETHQNAKFLNLKWNISKRQTTDALYLISQFIQG